MAGKLFALRHGQTPWVITGQHTGLTDLPLTELGQEQAVKAGERIRAIHPEPFDRIIASPSSRARKTAELAGYNDYIVSKNAHEWDYGYAEGWTREQVSEAYGKPWELWVDGTEILPESLNVKRSETMPDGSVISVNPTDGENIYEVYSRAVTLLDNEVIPVINDDKDVLIVAHSHFIRVLTAAWLHERPKAGGNFELGAAEFSVLGDHRGKPVVLKWGC